MSMSPREQREEYFNRLHHRGEWGLKINLSALWRKWRDRKRARRKAELLAHQEAYAKALHYTQLKPPLQKSIDNDLDLFYEMRPLRMKANRYIDGATKH